MTESAYDFMGEMDERNRVVFGAPYRRGVYIVFLAKIATDASLGYTSIKDIYNESTVVQDKIPISLVVATVRRELRDMEDRIGKKVTEVGGPLQEKTAFLEKENENKTNHLEHLYYISRSLDAVVMEVSSLSLI